MKITSISALLTVATFAIASPALADDADDAAELIALWAPMEVSIRGGALQIVLPQPRITELIYTSVLTAGLCMGPLYGKQLPSVTEIHVLNQFGAQGYVFENGLGPCETFNSRPIGDPMTRFDILGATHTR